MLEATPTTIRRQRTAKAARTLSAWYHVQVNLRVAQRGLLCRAWAGLSVMVAVACARVPSTNARTPSKPLQGERASAARLGPSASSLPSAVLVAELAAASPAGARAALPARSSEESGPTAARAEGPVERGWLGIDLAKRALDEPGVLVRFVVRGSPAARVGLGVGDVILSVDGENVTRPEDVSQRVGARGAGQRLRLGILQRQVTRLLAVELEPFPDSDELLRRQYVGLQAPEFDALQTAQGSVEPRLSALRGKVVVLEFWASWCGPCHLLSPVLERWHERFGAQGVVVAGVAAEEMTVVTRSAAQLGLAYPVFADPSGATTKAYRALALPTVFVLDKSGAVRDVMVGYSTPGLTRLESLVKQLITES